MRRKLHSYPHKTLSDRILRMTTKPICKGGRHCHITLTLHIPVTAFISSDPHLFVALANHKITYKLGIYEVKVKQKRRWQRTSFWLLEATCLIEVGFVGRHVIQWKRRTELTKTFKHFQDGPTFSTFWHLILGPSIPTR